VSIVLRAQRFLRRNVRRALHTVREPRARFIYDPRYQVMLSSVPMDIHRSENIAAFLAAEGLVLPTEFFSARAVSLRGLRSVHTDAYLDQLSRAEGLTRVFGFDIAQDQVDTVLMLQRLLVGGTKHAVHGAVRGYRTVVNLGGGLHHARPDSGHGFCAFNDVAIAIKSVRERGYDGRILVVDLDLHDGDGTRICFATDPSVHTFSVHNMALDDQPAIESTSVALGARVDDATYLAAIEQHLPEAFVRFRPRLVIYLAGADPAWDDRLGNWRITEAGMIARDRLVMKTVRSRDPNLPVVVLPAGGYGVNAWRYGARFFGELARGRAVEPPHTEEMTLARMHHLRRVHDPIPKDELAFSEADIFGELPGLSVEHRFLGYYTLHMLELVMERYGIFDRLRGLGFVRPTLDWNLRDPMGHTLRVFGDEHRIELVAEICVRRDRGVIAMCEVIYVEWMLLQNPRKSSERALLPGQRHPGLGLIGEVFGLLVLMCERLQVDGLAFIPAHYHLAALASPLMRMVDPKDEARLRALKRLQKGQSLSELSWALSCGHIHDVASGQVVRWEARPMVMPMSARLRERVSGPAYEADVEKAALMLRRS